MNIDHLRYFGKPSLIRLFFVKLFYKRGGGDLTNLIPLFFCKKNYCWPKNQWILHKGGGGWSWVTILWNNFTKKLWFHEWWLPLVWHLSIVAWCQRDLKRDWNGFLFSLLLVNVNFSQFRKLELNVTVFGESNDYWGPFAVGEKLWH